MNMINEAKLKKLIKLGAKKPSRNIVVKQNLALKSRRERLEAKGTDSLSNFFAKSQTKRDRMGLPHKLVKGAKEVFKEEYQEKIFNLLMENVNRRYFNAFMGNAALQHKEDLGRPLPPSTRKILAKGLGARVKSTLQDLDQHNRRREDQIKDKATFGKKGGTKIDNPVTQRDKRKAATSAFRDAAVWAKRHRKGS